MDVDNFVLSKATLILTDVLEVPLRLMQFELLGFHLCFVFKGKTVN